MVQESKRGVLSQFFKCDSEGTEAFMNLISFRSFVPEISFSIMLFYYLQ